MAFAAVPPSPWPLLRSRLDFDLSAMETGFPMHEGPKYHGELITDFVDTGEVVLM
jgi:hypothetical protein